MSNQVGLFAPVEPDADPMAAPIIAPPEHPYQMPVETYSGTHGRTAADGLQELKTVGYAIEHSWELEINETYNIDLPDGLKTTAAIIKDPDGNKLLVIWDPKPGNFFSGDEILRPGKKEIKI